MASCRIFPITRYILFLTYYFLNMIVRYFFNIPQITQNLHYLLKSFAKKNIFLITILPSTFGIITHNYVT